MAQGERAVVELVNSRTPLFEFVIRSVLRQLDLKTAEGASRPFVPRLQWLLAFVTAPSNADTPGHSRAGLGMDISEVARAVPPLIHARSERTRAAPEPGPPCLHGAVGRPVSKIERRALEHWFNTPARSGFGFEELGKAFSVPSYRAVHDAIRAAGGLDAFPQTFSSGRRTFRKKRGEKTV